jgi:hypothetical protein
MMPGTKTGTTTHTTADVQKVMRRVLADFAMIAESTGCWTPEKTADYAHDVEELSKEGHLKHVDVTLLDGAVEVKATRFVPSVSRAGIQNQRPGDLLWPNIPGATLRLVLRYNPSYDAAARAAMKQRLRIDWTPTDVDTSHAVLSNKPGREYSSNGFGIERTDWQ